MKTAYIINAKQFNTVKEYATAVGLPEFEGEWMDLARFLEVPINPKGGRRSIYTAYKSLNDGVTDITNDSDTAVVVAKPKKSVSTKVSVVQTAATVQVPVVDAVDTVDVPAPAPVVVIKDTPKSKAPRRIDYPNTEEGEDQFDADMTAWVIANRKQVVTMPAQPVAVVAPKPADKPKAVAAPVQSVDTDNVEETAMQLAKLLANLNTKNTAQPVNTDDMARMIQDAVYDECKELRDDIKTGLLELSTELVELQKQLGTGVKTIQVSVNGAPAVKIDGLVHEKFEDILLHVSVRDNVMLVGPAGSGKTTVCENVATALGLDFYCKSVCNQTSKSELLGYMDANGNFVSTEFRVAYENGGVFVLDEIDAGNPNVIAVLNSALANNYCAFADGMIRKHADFVLIACANTFGSGATREYVGRNQLDSATLDRFSVIEFGYDERLELALSADQTWCKFVQAVRKDLANERVVISPRASIQGGKLLSAGAKPEHVLQTRIIKGMAPALTDRARVTFAKFYKN